MIQPSVALLLTIFIFSVSSVQLINTPLNLPINSEKELSDFFLAKLGQNTGKISEQLKKFIDENKMSVMNAADQITLVLTSSQNVESNNKGGAFQMTQKFVKNLGKNMQRIRTHFLFEKSEQQVSNYIAQNLGGKEVHKISASPEQIIGLKKLFASPQRRVLQQTTQTGTSFSYITKFFFSIMFIIVVLGSFFAIANMENRKDTLLYAKFIADVGR